MKFSPLYTISLLLVSSGVLLTSVLGDSPLDFGAAQSYSILAGSTITSTGAVGTVITGNIGVSPGTAITGFPPAVLKGGDMSQGNVAAMNAQQSVHSAYLAAAAKVPTESLTGTDLGGLTLLPGVYKFDSSAAMNGMLTLDAGGDPNAVWTFQVGSSLLIAGGSSVVFKGGVGNPDFVYWQVGSSATLATGVAMQGNILAYASITMNTGATQTGRLFAENAAVTLDSNVIKI